MKGAFMNQNSNISHTPTIPNSAFSSDPSYFIDPTCYHGRPEDESLHLTKEIRTYDLLDELHIPYIRVDHSAMPTIEACHDVDNLLDIDICKNLFLCNAQKTAFYLLMMPGEKKFKTSKLSKQIGSARLSFGKPDDMERLLDLTPGSVSVLGLMNDPENRVQLLIDRDVIDHHAFIGCHPCINTSSLKISTRDILDHFLPAVHHEPIIVELPWEE